ncbi:hypothetical protein OKW43_008068 [Paraburkholderia sp. WC7.3g]
MARRLSMALARVSRRVCSPLPDTRREQLFVRTMHICFRGNLIVRGVRSTVLRSIGSSFVLAAGDATHGGDPYLVQCGEDGRGNPISENMNIPGDSENRFHLDDDSARHFIADLIDCCGVLTGNTRDAKVHRRFCDEHDIVDTASEFYLETVQAVFFGPLPANHIFKSQFVTYIGEQCLIARQSLS